METKSSAPKLWDIFSCSCLRNRFMSLFDVLLSKSFGWLLKG